MSFEVTLLVFGILLLLIGLVGKIKAKELEVGTSSAVVRIVTGFIGIVLVVLSFNPEIPRFFFSAPPKQSKEPAEKEREAEEQLDGEYTIQQKSNLRFADAWEGKHDNSMVTRDWQDDDTQLWILTPKGNNTYTIQQKSNLRFADAWLKNDYSMVTRNWQDDDTQLWIINPK